MTGERARPGDPALFERLAHRWWEPRGEFAMLHWLAVARAELIPEAPRPGAVLVDLGCGAGLLAPRVAEHGYTHIGVDRSSSALRQAADHGVHSVLADVTAVPLPDACADVVVAGEILEHVTDLPGAVAEACRLLKPGGLLVIDTLAATALCRVLAIHVAERIPKWATRGVHDPALLVDRKILVETAAQHGVTLRLKGIRPSMTDFAAWAFRKRNHVRMVPVRSTAVLFQAWGRKQE